MEGIVIKTKRLIWEKLNDLAITKDSRMIQMLVLKNMMCQYEGAKTKSVAVDELYRIAVSINLVKKSDTESELMAMINCFAMIINWDSFEDERIRKFALHFSKKAFKKLCLRHPDIPPEKILLPQYND